MFHFFGRMRGNGRKAAPDYRLLDYADHLRFILDWLQCIRQSDEGRMT